MKNVFVLLLAIVMTGGLLVGANAVNAGNAVTKADNGSCCPSTTTTIQKMDSGHCTGEAIQAQKTDACCPGEAAPITAEKESSCHDDLQVKTISGEECPSAGHCPDSGKSQTASPSKKSI
ncbi:hypothetical protein KQI52_01000 [bacterium]|nr:hypothetical protein [bacterium]